MKTQVAEKTVLDYMKRVFCTDAMDVVNELGLTFDDAKGILATLAEKGMIKQVNLRHGVIPRSYPCPPYSLN